MERVLFFGDSITWGAVDQIGLGWVNLIRKDFYQDPENNPTAYNLGVSGDTTEGLLKRFRTECEARLVDGKLGIVFAIGTNDSRYTNSKDNHEIPVEKFSKNLEQLIKTAREFTDKIAFIGLTDAPSFAISLGDKLKQELKRRNTNRLARYDAVVAGAYSYTGEDIYDSNKRVKELSSKIEVNIQNIKNYIRDIGNSFDSELAKNNCS